MLKYSLKVFLKGIEEPFISAIVPADKVFDWIEKYKDLGIIKAYILSDESEVF